RANRWTFCADARNTASPVCEPVAYLCLVDSTADTRCTTNTIVTKFCANSANADTAPCGVNAARWGEYAYVVDDKGTSVTTDDTRTKATIETITTDSPNTGFMNLPVVEYNPLEVGKDPGANQRDALDAAATKQVGVSVDVRILTLGNHQVGSDPAVNLLGKETDGAFFFNGQQNGRNIFYAGITPTTDLGAPLDIPTTATWHGRIHLYTGFTSGVGYQEDDFQLMVNFADGAGAGTLASVTTVSNAGHTAVVTIAGKFDKVGLVYGTTTVKVGDTTYGGLLTGLIGKEGAVGGFVADGNKGIKDDRTESTTRNLYAGAFVANNKICTLNPFNPRCRKEFADARAVVVEKCSGAGLSPIPPTMLVPLLEPEIEAKMVKIAECAEAKPSICRVTNNYDTTQFTEAEDYTKPFASLCDDDGTDVSIATVAALRKSACLADDTESPNCPA
ncbi:MAG: hypothetical protein K8953_00475, partial [Proteobacteria bacterium]|nr:hypothetical protein [Pseudomonadota bacterium]